MLTQNLTKIGENTNLKTADVRLLNFENFEFWSYDCHCSQNRLLCIMFDLNRMIVH